MTLEEARIEARGIWEAVARRRAATKKLSKIYERMTDKELDKKTKLSIEKDLKFES